MIISNANITMKKIVYIALCLAQISNIQAGLPRLALNLSITAINPQERYKKAALQTIETTADKAVEEFDLKKQELKKQFADLLQELNNKTPQKNSDESSETSSVISPQQARAAIQHHTDLVFDENNTELLSTHLKNIAQAAQYLDPEHDAPLIEAIKILVANQHKRGFFDAPFWLHTFYSKQLQNHLPVSDYVKNLRKDQTISILFKKDF